MRTEKILVVDDDPAIRRLIWKSLQSTGVLIYQSDSIEKTIDIMSRVEFDLFLLDISLEYENDGYHLAQMIRSGNSLVPIIFLSGKNKDEDIVTGLETGADLYMTKPFSPVILKAQVMASLDRSLDIKKNDRVKNSEDTVLNRGDFTYDKRQYQLYKKNSPIKLSSKENQLIQFFMENPNQVFSKEQIYQTVWGGDKTDTNTIMVFINHLRNKIEDDPKNAHYLQTVWGIGYTFVPSNN